MKKNCILMTLFLLSVLLFCGCKDSESANSNNDLTPTVAEPLYPSSHTVTFARFMAPSVSQESQNEINRILYEKGLDCQIVFVETDLTGKDYAEWLNMQEIENNNPIDIITSGAWSVFETRYLSEFLKEHFVSLNDYLETDMGNMLKDTYCAEEWETVSVDDTIYVVPKPFSMGNNEPSFDQGVYLSVNKEYAEYFSDFDGTYVSLKRIYQQINDDELHICIDGITDNIAIIGLLGYAPVYYGSFAYDSECGKIVDFTKSNEYSELVRQLYADINGGILIDKKIMPDFDGRVLCTICVGKNAEKDGWYDIQLTETVYEANYGAKYGVSCNSRQKELAFRILAECMSNPEIMKLLYCNGMEFDSSLLENRKEWKGLKYDRELTGILFEVSEDKSAVFINQIQPAISAYLQDLYAYDYSANEDTLILNPEWDYEKAWSDFLETSDSYSAICDELNMQITEWKNK